MAVNALPLLHKYVLSPQDDMELKLAKLKYRLCVKEVTELLVNRSQEKGIILSQNKVIDDDMYPRTHTLNSDDSGIGIDDSTVDIFSSPQYHKIGRISEEHESDYTQQNSSIIDDVHPSETYFLPLSSPSSSCTDSESEECEPVHVLPADGHHFTKTESNMESGFFENTHFEPEAISAYPSSYLESQTEDYEEEHKEMEVKVLSSQLHSFDDSGVLDNSTLTTVCSTNNAVTSMTESHEEDKREDNSQITDKACKDVDEALRILTTHQELPKVYVRKAVVTWSCWNVADLVRGPQNSSSLWTNNAPGQPCVKDLPTADPHSCQLRNRSNNLQVTHEKILNKDKKLANMLQKIMERDEEDQRMLKEFMKTSKGVPSAQPLSVTFQPSISGVDDTLKLVVQPPLRKEQVEKVMIVNDVQPLESNPTQTCQTAEEPSKTKKRKKQENVFHHFVHSLQRRFSKRGRETTSS